MAKSARTQRKQVTFRYGFGIEKLKPLARPGDPVVVICRCGNRTRPVSQLLSQQAAQGKVYNVRNGIKGWIGSGGAVVPAAQSIAACRAGKTC